MGESCKQCEEIMRIKALLPEYVKRLEKLEGRIEDHDAIIKELYTAQAETKIYVKQILDKINVMEGNLFRYLSQVTTDATTERIEDRKADKEERIGSQQEQTKTTGHFTELFKYSIGAIIGALVTIISLYFEIRRG